MKKSMDKFRQNRGYSLMSVIVLLGVMTLTSTIYFKTRIFNSELQLAKSIGHQARILNEAIEAYIVDHRKALANMSDNDCYGNQSCTPTEWFCEMNQPSMDQCELNLKELFKENYIAPGAVEWAALNLWQSNYKTVITRVLKPNAVTQGNPDDYNIRAITVTQIPWVNTDQSPRLGLLGHAIKVGGPDLAMTSTNPNIAQGLVRKTYNASLTGGTMTSWSADNSMNPWINAVGQLVMRAGFESYLNTVSNELLKRDGSRMMQNDLDMNGQRINNVQDAYVKNISGGRNLGSISPTWVFKYSWRVNADGATIQKPDCRVQSGGWTNRTTLNNPWDPSYSTADSNKAYDQGDPRILIVNDFLGDIRVLGYMEESTAPPGFNSGGTCPNGLAPGGPANTTSCPANDAYAAHDPAFRTRAKGAYVFNATDNGTYWTVNMRYYQDGTYNTAVNPSLAQGIASVYCYYDNKEASGCNGEVGCVNNGTTGPGASSANLNAPPLATSTNAYQNPIASGSPSQLPKGSVSTGAADVVTTF